MTDIEDERRNFEDNLCATYLVITADDRALLNQIMKRDRDGTYFHSDIEKRWQGWLARARLDGEWRPIESAPKDETRVICWNKEYGARESRYRFYGEGSIARGRYEQGTGPRGSWEWHEPQSHWIFSWEPTHWQPLPSPPKEDA